MDAVDIIILAAAGVGLVAFVVLAMMILRQGRTLKDLEQRIGPPVPPAAAASLERVRAVSAGSAAVVAAEDAPQPQPQAAPSDQPVPDAGQEAPPQTARQAAEAKKARKAEEAAARARAGEARAASASTGSADGGGGRGWLMGAAVVVIIALLGLGGWYLFVRDDGSGSSSAAVQQGTTATVADTGEVPEDVPPLANKAAYTVAVLNASDVTGAAANKVAPKVQADGYTLGVVDNASKQGLDTSQVQYVKGRKEVGWNLAKDLGVSTAVQVDSLAEGRIGTADAVIIVGKDLAK